MKVKELIEQLSKFDPETEVLGSCVDPTDFVYKVSIDSIVLDSPFDSNGYSGVDGSEMDDDMWDNEGNFIGEGVVVINLGDV
jgi:hypothetical protein